MTWENVKAIFSTSTDSRQLIPGITGSHGTHDEWRIGDRIAAREKVTTALGILGKQEEEYDKPTMDLGELVAFLFIMGVRPTEDMLNAQLRALQLDRKMEKGRSGITPAQAVFVWLFMNREDRDEDAILKRAFMFFDKDGNGEISGQELRLAMSEVGNMLTEEIDEFMRVMDRNGDGVVAFAEFYETLTQQTDLGKLLSEVVQLEREINPRERPAPAPVPAPRPLGEAGQPRTAEPSHLGHEAV
ncbi:hypothetical protein HYH03_011018 [Edaphochlamys debaryana]|uniref:EF-hand domain-containing protein n=1 Tax=Edaphochlamys debaryana TaxID=47281 RepID=A0A835XVZ7_9CHLO|nr:hypothetical protein HYH03_011018 [Edaphochlamys debaryana]|eukprot:KAG2490627.1 hypothetical protein HYH03_011018 [Edaphochlamys debaryana]